MFLISLQICGLVLLGQLRHQRLNVSLGVREQLLFLQSAPFENVLAGLGPRAQGLSNKVSFARVWPLPTCEAIRLGLDNGVVYDLNYGVLLNHRVLRALLQIDRLRSWILLNWRG